MTPLHRFRIVRRLNTYSAATCSQLYRSLVVQIHNSSLKPSPPSRTTQELTTLVARLVNLKRLQLSNSEKDTTLSSVTAKRICDTIVRSQLFQRNVPVDVASKLLMSLSYFQLHVAHTQLVGEVIAHISNLTYELTEEIIFPYVITLSMLHDDRAPEALRQLGPRINQLAPEMSTLEISSILYALSRRQTISESTRCALITAFQERYTLSTLQDCSKILQCFPFIELEPDFVSLIFRRVKDLLSTKPTRVRDIFNILRAMHHYVSTDRELYHTVWTCLMEMELTPKDIVYILRWNHFPTYTNLAYTKRLLSSLAPHVATLSISQLCIVSEKLSEQHITLTTLTRAIVQRVEYLLSKAVMSELLDIFKTFLHSTEYTGILRGVQHRLEQTGNTSSISIKHLSAFIQSLSTFMRDTNSPNTEIVKRVAHISFRSMENDNRIQDLLRAMPRDASNRILHTMSELMSDTVRASFSQHSLP